jgi:hypothetical protein
MHVLDAGDKTLGESMFSELTGLTLKNRKTLWAGGGRENKGDFQEGRLA